MIKFSKNPASVLAKKLPQINLVQWLVLLGVLVLVASLTAWTYYVHSNPNRVFWGMVENNLSTRSFTKTIASSESGQTTTQILQAQTSPRHITNGLVTIEYPASNTKVVTENIGTPYVDYISYKTIQTDQTSESGEKLDFSSVLNTWGKQEPQAPAETATKETSAQQ